VRRNRGLLNGCSRGSITSSEANEQTRKIKGRGKAAFLPTFLFIENVTQITELRELTIILDSDSIDALALQIQQCHTFYELVRR
jgi:hypothetical protein